MPVEPSIRWREFDAATDEVAPITSLLHRAYAPLGRRGLNYTAVDQSDDVTLRRLTTGIALVGYVATRPVATGTLYLGTSNASAPATYRRADCAFIGQLAVSPDLQRTGLGTRVCGMLEKRARESGRQHCALDTAESATGLLRWYEGLGYRNIDSVRWPGKTYRSLVLIKRLHERTTSKGTERYA